ncbi:hypothetical protein N9560_02665 [Hyphomicrobiales bacterium]|jgi:hypothetical protein|nr:hypothetical protein [Rhodobiaceae bacterium]MDB4128330.1 hypothetical protein [Hyphomicrobiales bacterium]MDB4831810.1 hypothetical protein [Hyphomicrobiales bacterium]
MKKLIIFMTVVVLTILFIFRNEHIEQSVLVNDQVKIGIKSDITIRKNRYTGNQCIFAGGEQLVEVFHAKNNSITKEALADNYYLKKC